MDTKEQKEQKEQKEPKKSDRVRSILSFAFSAVLFLLVFLVFLVVFNAKRQNKIPTFFGYSFSIVVTGSMEPDIHVGELLVVRECSMESINEGDDILFVSLSGSIQGEHVVHRVIEKGTDETGIYFRTKGTDNTLADSDRVTNANFVGKAVWHSVFMGKVFGAITDVRSLLILAVVALSVFFIIRQIIQIVRLAKTKEEPSGEEQPPENKI